MKWMVVFFVAAFVFCAWSNADAGILSEIEPNDTLLTAQDIKNGFTTGVWDPDVNNGYSWFLYSASVQGTGNGTQDCFKFSLLEPSSVHFDVDYAWKQNETPANVNLFMELFNNPSNPSFSSTSGYWAADSGSLSWQYGGTPDPYLYPVGNLAAGTYYVRLSEEVVHNGFVYYEGIHAGATYTLHIASTGKPDMPVKVVPEPVSAALFLLGGGAFAFRRRAKK